jgi:hypothetical protein
VIHFAATVLRRPLDPWQQWLVIHAGELLADGRPRFRQVLVIVARQNGKTHLCTILALFWLYVERWPLVFGTSNKLDYAKDSWEAAMTLALETPALAARTRKPRVGNGQQDLPTTDRCHYRIGAANEDGGRSKSIDRAIGDELRQQRDWTAYLAMMPALNARPHGQVVFITNMGDARSVVLNSLRSDALDAIAAGGVLERPVFLAEWSALPGSHPMDRAAWAAANPQLGRRMDPDVIEQAARRVAKPGADLEELNGFLTEILCLGVDQLDPALDPAGWSGCLAPGAVSLEERLRLAACVDVSPDEQSITLAVAALAGGRVRVEVVKDWTGSTAMAAALEELPAWLARVRPKTVGWFPGGPAATLNATLKDRRKNGERRGRAWPPRGVAVAEITSETPAVCMGFAALVAAGGIAHSGQVRLDTQAAAAEKLHAGDRWVFTRRGAGHVDAVYAVAGAAHLARTMPPPRDRARRVHVGPSG